MGDDNLDDTARDAKVILSTLTIESINPNTYTIVELVEEAHVRTCKRANADEVIVGSELSSVLISQAALNHGMSKFVSNLLSSEDGNHLYKIPIPGSKVGLTFMEVFIHMKQVYNSVVLAIQQGIDGEVMTNPPADYQLTHNDSLIIIGQKKPER